MKCAEDEALIVEVKFKVKDVLRYNMSVAWKSIANKLLMLFGVMIIVWFFYKMVNRTNTIDIFIAQNVILLGIPLLIFFFIPWRVWKLTLMQMQMPAFAKGVVYTFTKEFILLDIGEAKEQIQWDTFVKIVETSSDFRFYVDTISAQLIPKHNMTREQIEIFKQIAKTATKNNLCHFN